MRLSLTIVMIALAAAPLSVLAQNDAPKNSAKRGGAATAKAGNTAKSARAKAADVKPTPAITSEQEAAALSLVQKHHKDLFELLIYLKEGLPQEYERAIRDLSRANDRLTQFEKRDPSRYQLELPLWQAQSRRQLLTARLQMGFDESLLDELRETLAEEQRLELAVLRHERERLASRIEKLDEQIAERQADAEAAVERKLTALTKAAKAAPSGASTKNRKSVKNTKDPT